MARRAEGARPACELLEDGEGGPAAERRLREARAIAARIRQIVSGEAGLSVRERGDGRRPGADRAPRASGDVAVLFRRLTQLGPYERALREAGIPFRLARGGGFYQASEVRDVGELLRRAGRRRRTRWPGRRCSARRPAPRATARSSSSPAPAWRASTGSRPERLRGELAAAAGAAADAEPVPGPRELARVRAASSGRYRELRGAARSAAAAGAPRPGGGGARPRRGAPRRAGGGAARRRTSTRRWRWPPASPTGGGTAAELAAHLRTMAARPPREPEAELEAGRRGGAPHRAPGQGAGVAGGVRPRPGRRGAPRRPRRSVLDGGGQAVHRATSTRRGRRW